MKQILTLVAIALIGLGFVLVAVSYGSSDFWSGLNPAPKPGPKAGPQPANATKLFADVNGDDVVNFADFSEIYAHYAKKDAESLAKYDLDNDGEINERDLILAWNASGLSYPSSGDGGGDTSGSHGGGAGPHVHPLNISVGGYTFGSDTGILGIIMLVAGIVMWLWSAKKR